MPEDEGQHDYSVSGGTDNLKGAIRRKLGRFQWDLRKKAHDIELGLDNDAKVSRQIMSEVAPALSFLTNPEKLPKILEVKSDGKEYISIRRVEGSEIDRSYTRIENAPDVNNTRVLASIPTNLLGEGHILVFVHPLFGAIGAKNPQVEQEVRVRIGEKLADYANFLYLAMMGECPEMFKEEEWRPESMEVQLITRRNGKFFMSSMLTTTGYGHEAGVAGPIVRLNPTNDSRIEFLYSGYFQSQTDLEANRNYFKKGGRMYVLVEGSSEKEQQRERKPLAELKTTTPITT